LQYLKYLVGIFLLLYLFSFVDINELFKTLHRIDYLELILIILISFIFLISQALRLHMLIYAYVLNFYETAKLAFISQFFSNFLPGGLAGDFYKIHFLRQSKLNVSSGLAKIGIDRLSGSVILIILSLIYFTFRSNAVLDQIEFELSINAYLIASFLMIFLVISIMLFKFKEKIKSTFNSVRNDLNQIKKINLVYFVFLSLVVFVIRLIKFHIIFIALGFEFNFIDLIFLAFISQIAGMIPISIGGLGVIEASLFYGLTLFNVTENIAFAFVILNRFTIWIVSIVGGLYWLNFKKSTNKSLKTK